MAMKEIKDKNGKVVHRIRHNKWVMLNRIKEKVMNEDTDVKIVYSGKTGSGKSLAAMRDAYVIDPTLSLDRICFDAKEFVKAVVNGKKGQVIIADEAISMFFSRAAMTRQSRILVEMMDQIRQKNLVIMFCLPNVRDLDSKIARTIDIYVQVWEERKDGKTYKGNQQWFINFPGNPLARRVINHIVHLGKSYGPSRPPYCLQVEGGIVTKKKKVWYPVEEKKYRQKKEEILHKYIMGDDDDKLSKKSSSSSSGVSDGYGPTKMSKKYFELRFQRDKAIAIYYQRFEGKKSQRRVALELNMPLGRVQEAIQSYRAYLRAKEKIKDADEKEKKLNKKKS